MPELKGWRSDTACSRSLPNSAAFAFLGRTQWASEPDDEGPHATAFSISENKWPENGPRKVPRRSSVAERCKALDLGSSLFGGVAAFAFLGRTQWASEPDDEGPHATAFSISEKKWPENGPRKMPRRGSVAEGSKALDLGSSLFGGVAAFAFLGRTQWASEPDDEGPHATAFSISEKKWPENGPRMVPHRGSVAEGSKALDLGSSLFGGVAAFAFLGRTQWASEPDDEGPHATAFSISEKKWPENGPRKVPHRGSVAEGSKALDLGSSLFGGMGSNPTAASSGFKEGPTP
ncbi:unnamed protein product [Leuciscus chuanchicus]